LDLHAGLALTGLAADARQLVNKARSEASEYRSFYGSEIPGRVLADRLAGHVHTNTLYWHSRPFGCAVLVASYDAEEGPQLHAIEPSGVCYVSGICIFQLAALRAESMVRLCVYVRHAHFCSFVCCVDFPFSLFPSLSSLCAQRYFATAVGKSKQGSASELEKLDFSKLTVAEGVKHLARILFKLHDEVKDKALDVELSWVCDASKRLHVTVPDDIAQEAIRLAKESKKKEEMEDDDDDDDEKKA
jgi:20S proteasome subunit alpha 7